MSLAIYWRRTARGDLLLVGITARSTWARRCARSWVMLLLLIPERELEHEGSEALGKQEHVAVVALAICRR